MYGLIRVDNNGKDTVSIASLSDPGVRRIPKYATTIIARVNRVGGWAGAGVVKARLCLRGDQMEEDLHHLLLPTVDGISFEMISIAPRMYPYPNASIDVAQSSSTRTTRAK